jgi:hypothetical protein
MPVAKFCASLDLDTAGYARYKRHAKRRLAQDQPYLAKALLSPMKSTFIS